MSEAVFQVRFAGGCGLPPKTFYLELYNVQELQYEDLCRAVHEKLGDSPEFTWQQLVGPQPILELQVCGCTVTAEDMTPLTVLLHEQREAHFLAVVTPGSRGHNTLEAAAAALQDDQFMPHLVHHTQSYRPDEKFTWQVSIASSEAKGFMHGQAVSEFRHDAAHEMHLETRTCQDSDSLWDKLADAVVATEAQPEFESCVDDSLKEWAAAMHQTRQYVVSSTGSSERPYFYLIPYMAGAQIRLLGFRPLSSAMQEARALRRRIKLVLDLDETLVNCQDAPGLQYFHRQCLIKNKQHSPVRDAVCDFITSQRWSKSARMYRPWARADDAVEWSTHKLAIDYLDKELRDLTQTGVVQFVGEHNQWTSQRLCGKAHLVELPDASHVEVAVAVNHLSVKLNRIWVLLGSQVDGIEQLQQAIDRDHEIATWAPHVVLRVVEAKMAAFDKARPTAVVQLSGSLLTDRSCSADTAVFTYYEATRHQWYKLICMVRPDAQHMLELKCSRELNLHSCEVAVCTAAQPGYAAAVCKVLDPDNKHLRRPESERSQIFADVRDKALWRVTRIPRAAVILDDCPDRPHLEHGTVWHVESQRKCIAMQEYIPGCDVGDMMDCEQRITNVVTSYQGQWAKLRDVLQQQARQGPEGFKSSKLWKSLKTSLPSTEKAVLAVNRAAFLDLQDFRGRSSGSDAGSVHSGAKQHDMSETTSPAPPLPRPVHTMHSPDSVASRQLTGPPLRQPPSPANSGAASAWQAASSSASGGPYSPENSLNFNSQSFLPHDPRTPSDPRIRSQGSNQQTLPGSRGRSPARLGQVRQPAQAARLDAASREFGTLHQADSSSGSQQPTPALQSDHGHSVRSGRGHGMDLQALHRQGSRSSHSGMSTGARSRSPSRDRHRSRHSQPSQHGCRPHNDRQQERSQHDRRQQEHRQHGSSGHRR